jgi:hypothetical protein
MHGCVVQEMRSKCVDEMHVKDMVDCCACTMSFISLQSIKSYLSLNSRPLICTFVTTSFPSHDALAPPWLPWRVVPFSRRSCSHMAVFAGPTDCCYGTLQSRMQMGLASRGGFAVVNDTKTALWDDSNDGGWLWRRPRTVVANTADLYLFLHGHDYRGAVGDFVSLAGRTPLKPWRAHGVWWSREYPFNESQVTVLFLKLSLRKGGGGI